MTEHARTFFLWQPGFSAQCVWTVACRGTKVWQMSSILKYLRGWSIYAYCRPSGLLCVCVCVHFKCGLKHLRVPSSLRMWVIKQAFQTFEAMYLLPSIVHLSLMGRNSLKYKQGLIALVSFLTTLMAFTFLLLLPPSFFFFRQGKRLSVSIFWVGYIEALTAGVWVARLCSPASTERKSDWNECLSCTSFVCVLTKVTHYQVLLHWNHSIKDPAMHVVYVAMRNASKGIEAL